MRTLVGIVAFLVVADEVHAQAWHADVAIAAMREAWDRNEDTESFAGVMAGIDRRVWRDLALRTELVALRVWQTGDDAWLGGATIGSRLRWGPPALVGVLDVAIGVSNATRPVPRRGTRFNYLALVGAGMERPLGPARLSVTGRWLHASNNGREGRHRNPDVQALGVTVGIGWEF